MKKNKILYVDASRIKSGGGVLHLKEILKSVELDFFSCVIVFIHEDLEKAINNCRNNVVFKTNAFLNKNLLTSLFWQRYLLNTQIENKKSMLLTLDSTTLSNYKYNILINQDIIGHQESSLNFFKGKSYIYNLFKFLVSKRAVARSYASIFTTNYARSTFKLNNKKLTNSKVIPHGVESKISPKKNYSLSKKNSFNIIYVSAVLEYKNHNYIIDSIKNIATTYNLKLHFVGGGDLSLIKKLKQKISKFQLTSNIIFYPFLNQKQVFKLMRSSDLALFTSSVECFGITLLEYMRTALPIICSNNSSLPETLGNGGIYINLNKSEDLVNAIKSFYEDKALREKYGQLAYNNSLKYSWEITSKKTIEFIIKNYEKANMY